MIARWLSQPEELRLELIDGALLPKAAPTARHGNAQLGLGSFLRSHFHRRGGADAPGGWWIASEVDLVLDAQGFRPDLVGWRREHLPRLPDERPVEVVPDWICEVLSPSNRSVDAVVKRERYHRAGVPYFWLLDPDARTLTVLRRDAGDYRVVLLAHADEQVRAEPFAAVPLRVAELLGDDPEG